MSWTHTRAEIARTIKADPQADVSDLRRKLKGERLEDHVKKALDGAPPLTDEQRERIARLLVGGAA